jgi:hypothetical protein
MTATNKLNTIDDLPEGLVLIRAISNASFPDGHG